MIEISTELYKQIEHDMQEFFNAHHSHWNRIYDNGIALGEKGFAQQHPLTCEQDGDMLNLKIENLDGEVIYQSQYPMNDGE